MQAFERLEEEFGKWSNTKNVVACSSGTSALHLALEALRLPIGGEVVVPEFTMIACARAITMAGLIPVPIDCRYDLLLDPSLLQEKLTPNTVAIMPVHIYGRRCAMKDVIYFAGERGLAVIEDLAEGHGIPVHPETDAACWSFYRNKIVAGEEGGATAFKEGENANYARELRSVGFTQEHNFLHHPRGFNARLSNANAELILKSLQEADTNLLLREKVVGYYESLIPSEWRMPQRDVCWVYDLKLPARDQDIAVKLCNRREVQARFGFKPISMQPEYKRQYKHLNAYRLSKEIIYLPVTPGMTMEDCSHNIEQLKIAIGD